MSLWLIKICQIGMVRLDCFDWVNFAPGQVVTAVAQDCCCLRRCHIFSWGPKSLTAPLEALKNGWVKVRYHFYRQNRSSEVVLLLTDKTDQRGEKESRSILTFIWWRIRGLASGLLPHWWAQGVWVREGRGNRSVGNNWETAA